MFRHVRRSTVILNYILERGRKDFLQNVNERGFGGRRLAWATCQLDCVSLSVGYKTFSRFSQRGRWEFSECGSDAYVASRYGVEPSDHHIKIMD